MVALAVIATFGTSLFSGSPARGGAGRWMAVNASVAVSHSRTSRGGAAACIACIAGRGVALFGPGRAGATGRASPG